MRKESFYTIINDFSGFAEGRGKLHGVGREAGAFRRFHPFSSAKKAIPPLRQPPVPPLLFSFPGVARLVSGSGSGPSGGLSAGPGCTPSPPLPRSVVGGWRSFDRPGGGVEGWFE